MRDSPHHPATRVAILLVIALAAFFAYQGILDADFTGSDTIPLIQSGRIASVHDIGRVLSARLMDDTAFEGRFYRPVSVLAFQLDHRVWGLNPFGYHLTDLILHILVTLAVYPLGMRLTGGHVRTSLLAALLFTCHPLLVETVPAIARRQDVLEALLLVAAFLLFLRGREPHRRVSRLASLAFYVLALGTKETAVQYPALVAAWAAFLGPDAAGGLRRRAAVGLRAAAPAMLVTAVFLAWRTHVLGGLGEDGSRLPPLWIAEHYVSGLVYPQDFLALYRHRGLPIAALGGLLVLAGAMGGVRFFRVATRSHARRLALFLGAWILLPLPILVVTGSFAYRSLYGAVVPFSLLVSLILVRGLTLAWGSPGHRALAGVAGAAAAALAVSLIAYSPLLHHYPQWAESAAVGRRVLDGLERNLSRFPRGAVLAIDGLPATRQRQSLLAPSGTHSVSYLRDYSIQAWLELLPDDRNLTVAAGRPASAVSGLPELRIDRITPSEVAATLVWPAAADGAVRTP